MTDLRGLEACLEDHRIFRGKAANREAQNRNAPPAVLLAAPCRSEIERKADVPISVVVGVHARCLLRLIIASTASRTLALP